MIKIAVNRKFGGFGLSPLAVKRLAELQGRECHFFIQEGGMHSPLIEVQHDDPRIGSFYTAFDIANPDEHLPNPSRVAWTLMSMDDRKAHNEHYSSHQIGCRSTKRDDPLLCQVIEELGEKANNKFSSLEVVEIPDDVKWEINEYDGSEVVRECSREW